MTKKLYFNISATIFTIVGIFHVLRMVFGWQIVIGGVSLPTLASLLPAIFAGVLACYGWIFRNKEI